MKLSAEKKLIFAPRPTKSPNMSFIWSRFSTSRVFNWSAILSEWNNSMMMPEYVQIVLENLKEACNADSTHDPTLAQFLRYLNNEQEGIAWFLFEAVTHRWMWSTPRLDYVRELLDQLDDLDGYFPVFPGSPGYSQTIRQWVTENLDEEDLEYVNMMPALAPMNNWTYQTPTRRPTTATNAPRREAATTTTSTKPRYPPIEFRILRSSDKKQDDIIRITNPGSDLFNVTYTDQNSNVKSKATDLTQARVIDFLSITFRMLSLDEEPYENLQVILPGLPSIMVSPENLSSQARELIYEGVQSVMDVWPETV